MTTVDTRANGGKGKVTAKNEILVEGAFNRPAAVRHANGRDWWIMISDAYWNRHHCFLLDPQGIHAISPQYIGSKPPLSLPRDYLSWNGMGKFSPTGRYYLDCTPKWGFSLYDFDRCTGLLSNERRINYAQTKKRTYMGGPGIEFSPDERFLYLNSTHGYGIDVQAVITSDVAYMIQYDMQTAEWWNKGDTLTDIPPRPYDFLTGNYYQQQLLGSTTGPDGRIYVSYLGSSYCTVQYPDKKGKAAGFKYNNPNFNRFIYRGIPYLPNYRLGPLDGSPCDTLGLNNVPVANFRMDTPDSTDLQTRYFYNLAHHEPATWRWDFGDGSPNSTDTSALHTYAKPGKYRVCLTVSNRYGEDTYCREVYVGVTAAEEAQAAAGAVEIVPNPADEVAAVYLPDAPASNFAARLSVTDAVGRVVLSRSFSGQWTEVEVRSWPPGVYIVRVEHANGAIRTGKLVVAR